MKKAVILTVFLAMTCFACNRAQTTTIEGRVLTLGTDSPIDHPPVVVELIMTSSGGSMIGGYAVEVLDTVTTDEHGRYSITYDLAKNETYHVVIRENSIQPRYGYIRETYYPITQKAYEINQIRERGGLVHHDIFMAAVGWVEFHILNTNPQPGDEINYNFLGGLRGTHYGATDKKMIVDYVGNTYHNYAYRVTRNGEQTIYSEQVFPIAFDTIQVDIHY